MPTLPMDFHKDPRRSIVEVCRRLYERDYLVATSGNVSVRTRNGFLITPTCTRKDSLSPSMLVECTSNGRAKKARETPSCECPMHAKVYEVRNDVRAVIHAHPPYTLASALAGIDLSATQMPELVVHVGNIAKIEFAEPGSKELAEKVAPEIARSNVVILKQHGVLVVGDSLLSAFNKLEHLEHLAKVSLLAHSAKRSS